MTAAQAAGRFKEVVEEDITRLCGILFGIIKQMQHLCGVASMSVSSPGGYNHAGNPTEMLHLFNVFISNNRNVTLSCCTLPTSLDIKLNWSVSNLTLPFGGAIVTV